MAVFGPGDLMDDFARKDADKASAPDFQQWLKRAVERAELAAEAAATITRLSADLEEARGLLNEAPVLVVNREAAKRTDDREALKYAREIHPWAVRARAFLTRTEPRHD